MNWATKLGCFWHRHVFFQFSDWGRITFHTPQISFSPKYTFRPMRDTSLQPWDEYAKGFDSNFPHYLHHFKSFRCDVSQHLLTDVAFLLHFWSFRYKLHSLNKKRYFFLPFHFLIYISRVLVSSFFLKRYVCHLVSSSPLFAYSLPYASQFTVIVSILLKFLRVLLCLYYYGRLS